MPLLPFLMVVGVVIVAIQKIAQNAPITGVACLILVLLVVVFLANLSSKKTALKETTRRAIISEFKWNDDIDPLEFENRCAEAMQLSGWTARTTKKTGDQGVDVLADKRGTKVVLQCKLYTNTVGNKAVQEVFAAKTFSAADFAAVVSQSSYTRGAKELAEKTGVLLLHYSELRQANLLFGFPADGVPPLQYQGGVTPSDVTRARGYVIFCAIASLPVFLVGLAFDAAHNKAGIQTSEIETGSQDRAPVGARDLAMAAAPDVTSTIAPQAEELPVKSTAFQPFSTIAPIPTELPAIARTAPLPAELNETFRDMIFRSGRSCLAITDHVWVNRAHVSLVCDRKLRVAFIQDPQGWRFARTRE